MNGHIYALAISNIHVYTQKHRQTYTYVYLYREAREKLRIEYAYDKLKDGRMKHHALC